MAWNGGLPGCAVTPEPCDPVPSHADRKAPPARVLGAAHLENTWAGKELMLSEQDEASSSLSPSHSQGRPVTGLRSPSRSTEAGTGAR